MEMVCRFERVARAVGVVTQAQDDLVLVLGGIGGATFPGDDSESAGATWNLSG